MPTPINSPELVGGLKKVAGVTGRFNPQVDSQIAPTACLINVDDTPYRENGDIVSAWSITPVGAVGEHAASAMTWSGDLQDYACELSRIVIRNTTATGTSYQLAQFTGAEYIGWTHASLAQMKRRQRPQGQTGVGFGNRFAPTLVETQLLTAAQRDRLQGLDLALEHHGAGGFGVIVIEFPKGQGPVIWSIPRSNGVSPGGLVICCQADQLQMQVGWYGRLYAPPATGGTSDPNP